MEWGKKGSYKNFVEIVKARDVGAPSRREAAVMGRMSWREMGNGQKMGFGLWLHIEMKGRGLWRSERIFFFLSVVSVIFKFIKCLTSRNIFSYTYSSSHFVFLLLPSKHKPHWAQVYVLGSITESTKWMLKRKVMNTYSFLFCEKNHILSSFLLE